MPNLNLRNCAVGDSGDMVAAIHEQLQNVGLDVQDGNLFLRIHIITYFFQKYLKKLIKNFTITCISGILVGLLRIVCVALANVHAQQNTVTVNRLRKSCGCVSCGLTLSF